MGEDRLSPATIKIDLPQAVNAAGHNSAGALLERDVGNVATFFSSVASQLAASQYGKEIWGLYQAGLLTPGTPLTGRDKQDLRPADVGAVINAIHFAGKEEAKRQLRKQMNE